MRTGARFALLIGLGLAACGATAPPLPPDAAILPESTAAQMLHQCSRRVPPPAEATWMPQSGDIVRLEVALPPAILGRPEIRRSHYSGDPGWSHVPQGWQRQYVGIVRGGRRFIYGNFYPLPNHDIAFATRDWRTRPEYICDGGAVIFGAEYDVEAGRFTQIEFNGDLG